MNATEMPLERPWQALDPAVREVVTPAIGPVAEEITAAIAASINEYRQPMRGAFGRGVRLAIDSALRQFVEQIGQPASGVRPGREIYIALGRGEYRAGRPLDALQAAYRLGARVAWRRIAAVARESGIDGATLSLLAESIFAYIDELSAESVEGYATEQAASAGERQRSRQALVRLLVGEGASDPVQAQAASRAADWELPRRAAAVVADERNAERLAALVGEGAIAARVEDLVCVVIGDPDAPGRRARLAHALANTVAALGPTVAPDELPLSFGRAARCVRLVRDGVLAADGLVETDEVLGALALFSDRPLLDELAKVRLEPLAGLTPAARGRLESTLLSWLRNQGNVAAAARELHVHPQTVRYRLTRLREYFGERLDIPDERFELELALRAKAAFTEYVARAPSQAP